MGLLDGKVAVITGAGGGLGREYALLMAKEGAKVVVNDIGCKRDGTETNESIAMNVVEEIRNLGGIAVPSVESVSTVESSKRIVETAVREFGGIDILVNNAGILRDKTLLKMEEEMWDIVIEVHLKGSFLCAQAASSVMKAQGRGGRIINTTSIAGLMGNFGQTNYAAAKAGIYGMTLVWAKELSKYGINVNAIAPIAKTRMTEDIESVSSDLTPDLVAPFVLFLASDLSKDVNGRIFGIHGRHIFEYRMMTSKGVEKKEGIWTPSEILEKLGEIGRFDAGTKGEAEKGEGISLEGEVDSAFKLAPLALITEKAEGYEGIFQFKISGAKDKTITVRGGGVSVEDGLHGTPSCLIEVDAETIAGIFKGRIKEEKAFMEGKIKASNIPALIKFGQLFDFKRALSGADVETPAPVEKVSAPLINRGIVGKKYRGRAVLVHSEAIKSYAHATNDPNPYYIDESREGGIIAPPLFPVRLLRDLLYEILTDREAAIDLTRVVHGEQDILIHDYLRPGDLIAPRATISDIEEKSTGTLVKVNQNLYREGIPVIEMYSGFFIRGEKKEKKTIPSVDVEEEKGREYLFKSTMKVTQDQSIRYADASGDNNPIHLDSNFAKAAGLPDIILQGLCTMAFTSRAIITSLISGDPRPLKRLKVRFSRYVLMGDELLTRGWLISEDNRKKTIGFETINQKGEKVITEGVAEIAL